MSNTSKDNFWTDEKVFEFARRWARDRKAFQFAIDEFKASQPVSSIEGRGWEILKKCPIEGTIYQVKRLIDGEVFSVGDSVAYLPPKGQLWKIDNFFIGSNDIMLARSKDNLIVEVVDDKLFKMSKEPIKEVFFKDSTTYTFDIKIMEAEYKIKIGEAELKHWKEMKDIYTKSKTNL